MEKEKIKFENLSGWLKATVVVTWVLFGITALSFLVGFVIGLLGL